MHIRELKLISFRNYKNLSIEFDSDVSILYGQNAQGKTNILEAIYLCSCLRSHRTSRDSDLIMHEDSDYQIELKYCEPHIADGFCESINIAFYDVVSKDKNRTKSRRLMKHNGITLNRTSDIIGLFNAVIFAPEDLNIIKEGPSARRRYMDLLISQVRPSYFYELTIYQKVLMQRNNLLKQMRDGQAPRDYELIEAWDYQLADSSAKIIATRNDFVQKINNHASRQHLAMSSGKEKINVKYRTIAGIALDVGIKELKESIHNKLKSLFNEDVEKGLTNSGAHRDDLEIMINGESIRIYASQGQQRTTVLSLKIAELEIINEETGSMPVLLLDDVMSELDETRRKQLLSSIGKAQVILTCTDREHAAQDFIKDNPARTVKYYQVTNGSVTA